MNLLTHAVSLLSVLALTACTGSTALTPGPILGQTAPVMQQQQTLTPAQNTALARAMTDVGPYVEPAAFALMSDNDRVKAADAQFNALQFGRPGAPRNWAGDASGNVTVGPFVRVNNLDCRDFTHSVTVGGKALARKGTACRENGLWTVVSSGTA